MTLMDNGKLMYGVKYHVFGINYEDERVFESKDDCVAMLEDEDFHFNTFEQYYESHEPHKWGDKCIAIVVDKYIFAQKE